MKAEDLDGLLKWMDPAEKPLILQLPRDEYARRIKIWRIPDITLTDH